MTDNSQKLLQKCIVASCPNYDFHPNHHFFPLPTDDNLLKLWKEKCGITSQILTTAKICSNHFKPTDFRSSVDMILKQDAFPTENLTENWPKFMDIKTAVDTNEQLKQKFEALTKEESLLKEKVEMYQKKIVNLDKEITKMKKLVSKTPRNRSGSNLIYKVFSHAQINMLLRKKKKVVWSYDDMAMAFTLRHMANRECYLFLKNTLNMPLPALSAVQRWAASVK